MNKKIIAVDLGGTHIRVSLVKNLKIINYIKEKTPKNKKELLEKLDFLISDLMDKDVYGIAVASPGPLKNGVIKNTPNLDLRYFDLKNYLKKRYKVRVEVENDAKCVALAESKLGYKKKNFIILTLGTGIGGGIIIDGKLYKGFDGYAGEVGHMIVDDGKSFEEIWQFLRRKCNNAYLGELLKRKDKFSKNMIEDTSFYLGIGISSLINIFDPEIVVLAGGVKGSGEKFLKKVRKYSSPHTIIPRKVPIVWTKLDHSGTLGAALLFED